MVAQRARGNVLGETAMKKKLYVVIAAALCTLALGCKTDVPPGGACSSDSQCGSESAACYFPSAEASEGYCTRSCRIDDQMETKPCPEGLSCNRVDNEHFILGATVCTK